MLTRLGTQTDTKMEQREKELGFAPQRERIYNKLLPYSEQIDAESNKAFAEIKFNLAKSIARRDIKYGASHWVGMLARYIRLYGLKFSKEDHLALIKLMYELIIIPDLELTLVQKFAPRLTMLIKKTELLSRDDLVIPWRPLYELIESIAYSQYEPHGLQLFPPNIENVLKNLIKHCRPYFSVESTQEMLDEWRPLLCPLDMASLKAIHYLEYFLPTNLPPSQHQFGFKLWFEEFMHIWDSFLNVLPSESGFVNLFARLADGNIGYIDWSPYVQKIFNRFLRSFNLPVGTRSVRVSRSSNSYEINAAMLWIVSMLGGGSDVQDYVDKMFKTLQTYYHPSNLGKWSVKLSGLLMAFPVMFARRIHRERYKKPSWENQVPDSHKLTENDITRFVESMKPVVYVSMFSKYGSQDSAIALRHLSNMRPEIIIPTLMEKMYPALENLTEPHRLIACMNCIVAVARPMLFNRKWYPEGRTHLLPLLNLSLPGVDPNDFKKTLVTFQMISTFVTLVPIVDCSEALFIRNDLTDIEKELCSATAQFEDFVLQFLDRIFALIENNAQDHIHGDVTRLNPEQTMLEVGLTSTVASVLQQCSSPIFKSALSRIHTFMTTSVYESRVGGRFAANLLRAAAKVDPVSTVQKFLPYFCTNIKNLMENHEELKNEEQLDDGFLWNMLMLPQLVRCDGVALLPYKTELLEVLQHTLHLKCIQGYEMAGQLLRNILRSQSLIYPLDYKSIPGSLDRPVSEYLAIEDWACPGDIDNIGMKWHVPNEEEIEFASDIISCTLEPELDAIKNISAENQMNREELLQRLNVILECILGAGSRLPMWEGTPVEIQDSEVPLVRPICTATGNTQVLNLKGQNIRETILDVMRPLLAHMLSTCEDDTKGLFKLLRIYESLLFFHGAQKNDFDTRCKGFHAVKQALEDKMRQKKRHIRALLVDRVQLQQELRMLNDSSRTFTQKHQDMLDDLHSLSVSRYGEVRKKAQGVLFQSFQNIPYSSHCIVPNVVKNLENTETPEHQFKGTLYIVLESVKRNIHMRRSWEALGTIWPALVQAQRSEKPSILKVIDEIIKKLSKNLESIAVNITVSDGVLTAAGELQKLRTPSSAELAITSTDLTDGQQYENKKNSQYLSLYYKLVDDLVNLIEKGNLTWKFSQIGLEMLSLLLRHDVITPAPAVQLFVKGMVHDSLYVRKLATGCVSAILKQQKRKHKCITVDPYKVSGTAPPSVGDEVRPGEREDNSWLLYNKDDLPITKEKWESTVFVEKTHWGYYCWPKDMKIYAPISEQPKLDRSREELSEPEGVIFDSLSNPEYVKKFVDYLALEEQKRKDKFRRKLMTLFKGLFRNYGDTFLDIYKPHVERLMSDTSHDTHDSSQRCAMEMLSGIIRSLKHWPYEKAELVKNWCLPILKKAVNSITVETQDDWGTFFTAISENREPKKLHWFFELVMDNPLSGEGGSFGDSSRLFILQSALYQQEWRVPNMLHRLLEYLQPHLTHPYKNVRDRIGSLLSSIFLFDYKINPKSKVSSPSSDQFFKKVIPLLDGLQDTVLKESIVDDAEKKGATNCSVNHSVEGETPMEVEEEGDEERKTAVRLCKTVMKMIVNNQNTTFQPSPPEAFPLLKVMCTLESESTDDELKSDCILALSCFSQALLQPEIIPRVLGVVREVMGLQSWHARVAVLGYLQVMVFCNFFTLHCPHYISQIRDIVLHLICDDQVEVREMAAVTLSGLLHCGFLEMNKEMMEHFEHLSRTKLKKRKKLTDTIPLESIIKRHAGVLGLGAVIQAYPYDVPNFMPQILMDLGNHVNDPQPIQMTVKKTLSDFRRTHHDNWHDHKQMFTDDQLVVLTDLLVSPTYYA